MASTDTYTRRDDRRVWYVAYGSNLSRERFLCYLRGGTPAGGSRVYRGCADPSDPVADVPLTVGNALYFAGTSRVWGGSMAFIEGANRTASPTLGRAYLITVHQFQSVFAQENRLEDASVDVTKLRAGGVVDATVGTYGRALYLGERDGCPLITFTARVRAAATTRTPSRAYLRTMAEGLADAHGFDIEAIVDYLAEKPGIAGALSPDALADLLAEIALS